MEASQTSSPSQAASISMDHRIDISTNSPTITTTTTRVLDEARIEIIPFGVPLTKSELRTDWDKEPTDEIMLPSSSSSSMERVGVVGTITMLTNAAIVWVGWGRLIQPSANEGKVQHKGTLGTGTSPSLLFLIRLFLNSIVKKQRTTLLLRSN
jgi:hypothetical protein